MSSLTLLVHRVADLDQGGFLLVIAKAVSTNIGEDHLPDALGLQVVVDPGRDVGDAGSRVKQDGGNVGLLVLEGSHLQPGLEVVDQVRGKGVAHNNKPVVCIGVAVSERGDREGRDPNSWDLVTEWKDVTQVIKETRENITPITIGCFILKHISYLSTGFEISFGRFIFDLPRRFVFRI